MHRIPALVASVVIVAAGLSGCALLDDVGDSDLDDALELVPEGATTVTFTDRQVTAERLGVDDVETGDDLGEIDRYIKALLDDGNVAGGTEFANYLVPMSDGAAFSELDIVWEATASVDDGSSEARPRIYKMSDDLDLDAVGDDLIDVGYEEDEIDGHRHFSLSDPVSEADANGTIGGYPAVQMTQVVVVPDDHLMFVGSTPDTVTSVVEVFEDDADSATDAGHFDDVLDGADDPEVALLTRDVSCNLGGTLTPDLVEAAGLDSLGTPEATAFFVAGDEAETSSVLAFADDDAAQADLEAREDYLDEGVLLKTRQPVADVADWEIERDGNLVRIDYEYDNPGMAFDAAYASDGFHACNPG